MQGLLYGVRPERWAPPDDIEQTARGLSRTPMVLKELDRPTLLPRRLGRGQDPPHRNLRVRRQDGLHGLRRRLRRQRAERLLHVPHRLRPRGRRRCRRGRPGGDHPRGGPAGRPQPVALVRATGHRPALRVVPGRATTACAGTSPGDRSRPASIPEPRRTHPAASPSTSPRTSRCSFRCPTGSATRWRFWPTPSPCRCIRSRVIRRRPAARSSSTAAAPSAPPSPPSSGPSTPTWRSWSSPASRPRPRWHGDWAPPWSTRSPSSSCSKRRRPGPAASSSASRAAACPMAHPGGFDVVYDTVGTAQTAEIGVRLLKARGHHGQERRARAGTLGMVAAVLQGDLLGRLQRLRRRGGRRHPHARDRPLPAAGRRGPCRPDGDADPHLPPRAVARRLRRAWRPRRRAAPSRWPSTSVERRRRPGA